MRVLVTGHDGYIGCRRSCRYCERAGHDVVGLDTVLYAGCALGPTSRPRARASRSDVRDVQAAELAGFDAVIHLAAISNDPLGDLNPDMHLRHQPPRHGAARRRRKAAGVARFLFSSSCSLYGAAGDELLDETAAFNPVTPYGALEGAAPSRTWPSSPTTLQPDLPAQRAPPTASRHACAATSS